MVEKSFDTAYLTPVMQAKFTLKLLELEAKHKMDLVRVDCVDAPQYGKGVKAWTPVYQNVGIKQGREFKRDIRKLWEDFPNPLSRSFK